MKTCLMLVLLLMSSCFSENRLIVYTLGEQEVVSIEEPNVAVTASVKTYESHTTFRCSAQWIGEGPLDIRAPLTLKVNACIAGKCDTLPGNLSEVTIWKSRYHTIKEDTELFCFVSQPEWYTMKGVYPFVYIDEVFPEHVVYTVSYSIKKSEGKVVPTGRYCMEGYYDNGWVCTAWE